MKCVVISERKFSKHPDKCPFCRVYSRGTFQKFFKNLIGIPPETQKKCPLSSERDYKNLS